jgi:hypothetical protein
MLGKLLRRISLYLDTAGVESIDVTALEVEHSTFGCASIEEAITSLQEPQAWPPAVSPVETVYEVSFPLASTR